MILYAAPLLTADECALLRGVFDRHLPEATETDFSGQPVLRLRQFAADCPGLVARCRDVASTVAIDQDAADYFPLPVPPRVVETTILTKMSVGGYHAPHADNCKRDEKTGEWVLNHTPHRTHTALLYLSGDFKGGRLIFPQHGVIVHPMEGQLVVFPADSDHEHAVDPVTEGRRYSLVMWLTGKLELAEKID